MNSKFRYTGYTNNLKFRLDEHNRGLNKSTNPFRPFELDAYVAVKSKKIAQELEKYFKTGSELPLQENEF
jgi:putative endonuclease